MTGQEYIQLKAFARIDGFMLSVLWLFSFGFYMAGLTSPLYGFASMALTVATPFFVGFRLRKFRDEDLEGFISFMRAWAYVILVFFYAGIAFAIAQYLYLNYMDQGYLMQTLATIMSTPEAKAMIEQAGLTDEMAESLHNMQAMRPIDIALNMLTMNIMLGIIVGLPVAALLQKKRMVSE